MMSVELLELKEKFDAIVTNVHDVIFRLSPSGRIEYVNPKVKELYGYQPEELIGYNLRKTTPARELPKALKALGKVSSGKIIKNFEIDQLNNKGMIVPTEINIVPVKKDGKVIAVLGVMRDITERRKAEKKLEEYQENLERIVEERTAALKEVNKMLGRDIAKRKKTESALKNSEVRLKILFEHAPDAIYLNDLKGNFVDGNKAAEELIGYKREELIGGNNLKLKALFASGQIQKAAKALAKNALGISTGPDDFILNHKDGHQVVAEIRTHPVKIRGESLVLGIARDITNRKSIEEALRESEKRYRQAVDNSPNPIFAVDRDGLIQMWNPACTKVFQYEPNEIIGQSFHKLLVNQDYVTLVQEELSRVLQGVSLSSQEISYRCKDGTQRFTTTRLYPLYSRKERVQGCIFANTDITGRIHMEDALRENEEKFRAISKTVQDAIVLIDDNSRISYWNPAAEKIFGYRSNKVIGEKIHKILGPEWHFKALTKMVNEVNERTPFGNGKSCERKAINEDGLEFPVNLTVANIIINGAWNVLAVIRDISRRRKSEEELEQHKQHLEELIEKRSYELKVTNDRLQQEIAKFRETQSNLRSDDDRFRDLLENANDLIQSVDSNGSFVYVNKKWLKTLGYSKLDLEELRLPDILRKDQIPHCMDLFKKICNGETIDRVETVFLTKDGREVPVEGSVNPHIKNGSFIATRGIFREMRALDYQEENPA